MSSIELKRKAENDLKNWKKTTKNSKAIIIKGARRVGKTHLAEKFAASEYKTHIVIDFSSPRQGTIDIFEKYGNRDSLNELYNQLSVLYEKPLYEKESAFVFDEIQKYPKARELVKHLVADNKYDYIETGSLISIRKNVRNIVIPSEEDEMNLYPLDFEEFLSALSDETTIPFIFDAYTKRQPLGRMLKPVMDKMRNYMLVGGMPQSVTEYITSGNIDRVEKVKRGILKVYREDIAKYAEGYEAQARAIFDAIPAQLAHHDKKIKYSGLGFGDRAAHYDEALYWIGDSMVGNLCYAADGPELFGEFALDQRKVKCYMGDTGLLLTLAAGDNYLTSELYKSFMLGKLAVNKGMLTENFVAQILTSNGHKLRFYESSEEVCDKKKKYEIDFMVAGNNKTTPVEVKSGNSSEHSSLDYFCGKYKGKSNKGILLTKGDLRVTDKYIYLPLPMTQFL